MAKKINKRIGNLSIRTTKNLRTGEKYLDIVKWQPNRFFGDKQRMIEEEGYKLLDDGSIYKSNHFITESCFVNPESYFTVAYLQLDAGEYDTKLNVVGSRPLDLNKKEREAFFKLWRYGHCKLLKQIKQHED